MSKPQRTQRGGRSAFVLNASVSVALLGLIAAIALVVKPAAPPGIAEFAPQAAKPITKAPQGQSSTNGDGKGACASGQACEASPKPSPKPVAQVVKDVLKGVPSSLQCYTWPDGSVTQTFDPQSPPCVANWPEADKGNGGATSPGVSASAIRVAMPTSSEGQAAAVQPIVDFFNTRYQLYGRKLQLVPFNSQQASTSGQTYEDPTFQHADAVAATSLKPFAAMDFLAPQPAGSALPAYLDYLADHKIISLSGGAVSPATTNASMAAHAPYQWTYQATVEDILLQTAKMACAQLVGKNATHSGAYATKRRTFAMVLPDPQAYGGPVPGVDRMVSVLKACGVPKPEITTYDVDGTATMSASFSDWKQRGITSLFLLSFRGAGGTATPMAVANNQRYSPEWILMGKKSIESANVAAEPKNESSHAFGVATFNRLFPLSSTPWFLAYNASNGPQGAVPGLNQAEAVYNELKLLAAGIQMAGPGLTPQAFQQALLSTTFPNPGAGTAPSYQGTVGFPSPGAAMMRDYVGFWIDPDASLQGNLQQGLKEAGNQWPALCWVDLGERHVDTWPKQDHFRQGSCR